MLTIVNEGSLFMIVNEGLSLMIANETTNFIKTVVFGKPTFLKKKFNATVLNVVLFEGKKLCGS